MASVSLSLRGAFTALVTPFTRAGESIDWAAFDALVEAQIAGGIAGLIPCGTTGESPTLDDDEQAALIKRTVDVAKGRVPVVAGTGSFSTKKTIAATERALAAGAAGVMVVMPYYSKPSQEGLFRHLSAVARGAAGAPVVLYNVPGRTQSDLDVETTLRVLEASPNVVGLKDASGNVLRCQELKRRAGDRVTVLSGDDALTVPMMAVGAEGVISVTSNVYPAEVARVTAHALAGRWAEARAEHFRLLPVHEIMFAEPNPAPAKAALARLNRMEATLRLPLVEASGPVRERLAAVLDRFERATA
ncbi:MAG: 4-hydroxy-tetrahydrodipicolinate synthase [Polyangiaceae bacterium]|jgi:4-hydroxy-tetrahydrodipicolinate synthase|nr:4-hydroxy-tetrahydrodipicolinate synthase [Polyangiaceae bacterium]